MCSLISIGRRGGGSISSVFKELNNLIDLFSNNSVNRNLTISANCSISLIPSVNISFLPFNRLTNGNLLMPVNLSSAIDFSNFLNCL